VVGSENSMGRAVTRAADRWSGRRRLRHRDHPADLRSLPDPTQPAGEHLVPQIRHVVLLMMENHSFDSYLGTLGRGDGLPDPPPTNPRRDGCPVPAHHFTHTRQVEQVPSQSWRASHEQYGCGRNDGFATSIETAYPNADATLGMGYWTEGDLPFYHSLAATFPLADRWFCSCLGPTFPNRRFLMAATANGLIDDQIASIIDYPRTGTIFDLLNRHNISWTNYHHVTDNGLLRRRIAGRGGLLTARSLKILTGQVVPTVEHRVRGDIQCTANLYPLGLFRTLAHLSPIQEFFRAAEDGTLPAVSIVDPDFAACSEENPQDIQIGEGFAARVIDAVMRGAGWQHTVLIWFYDEHGGYYDHVPPPAAVEPDDVAPHDLRDSNAALRRLLKHTHLWRELTRDDAHPGRYDRYGFRVPAAVVSPYAKPDYVSSTTYDHTSALRLIEEIWNLPPLTRRDAAATAPWDMLDLASRPAFLAPPPLKPPSRRWQL
jgi:phospholipase C